MTTVRVQTAKKTAAVEAAPAPVEEVKAHVKNEELIPYRLQLSPPWTTYWREIQGLFLNDPQITVKELEKAEDGYSFNIYVDDQAKYEALAAILKPVKEFGNVKVTIQIIPADASLKAPEIAPSVEDYLEFFATAFKDTGRVVGTQIVTTPTGTKIGYVITDAGIYQFFNDDLTTLYGWKTMTIEDMFRDVFSYDLGSSVIYYSSEIIR